MAEIGSFALLPRFGVSAYSFLAGDRRADLPEPCFLATGGCDRRGPLRYLVGESSLATMLARFGAYPGETARRADRYPSRPYCSLGRGWSSAPSATEFLHLPTFFTTATAICPVLISFAVPVVRPGRFAAVLVAAARRPWIRTAACGYKPDRAALPLRFGCSVGRYRYFSGCCCNFAAHPFAIVTRS